MRKSREWRKLPTKYRRLIGLIWMDRTGDDKTRLSENKKKSKKWGGLSPRSLFVMPHSPLKAFSKQSSSWVLKEDFFLRLLLFVLHALPLQLSAPTLSLGSSLSCDWSMFASPSLVSSTIGVLSGSVHQEQTCHRSGFSG